MILLFFMDGLKYEMVDRHMPFMASLNKMPLKSELGYSCACHATMYTGKYIQEHNTWFVWKRGKNSPYKWLRRVPLLKYFNIIPVKVAVSRVTRLFHKNTSYPGIPMLVNLPLKYWGEFEPCESVFWDDDRYLPGINTIFKELRRQKIAHRLVGFSKKGDVFAEEGDVDYAKEDFIYYFIGEVDECMHRHGEFSQESAAFLKRTDDFIRASYEKARATGKPVTAICFSDHGHVDVENKIDINDYFVPRGLNVKDYLQLTESTFIRFWFRNDQERAEVMPVLNEMIEKGLGFIVDDKIQTQYHLRFSDDQHGQVIFHLSAPNVFANTIWGFARTVKSMHGYWPELAKHYGVFASNKPLIARDFARLTDLFPTLRKEMGLDMDKTLHGEALLADEAAHE